MPTYSGSAQLGTVAPPFALKAVDDRTYTLESFKGSQILVIAFMCNHCPYVIAVQERMNHLAREFLPRGVQLIGINSNDSVKYPDDSFQAMKLRAAEQGFVFPYLHDETQDVAKAYGAVCTPEFYAYRREGSQFILRYQGRLDDSWKDPAAVTRRELAEALELLLQGKNPGDAQPAMGCSIKWK